MGIVFDIKHYAIHDGPGIRTTVFLKGCPLDCPWCHNPESKSMETEFMWIQDRCIGCGACVEACQSGAITFNIGPVIDETKCVKCSQCVEACYTEALKQVGVEMSVAEVMAEIEKDRIFHDESGGGVTFSGGEPIAQPEFLKKLLVECKRKGIHTTIDTGGLGNPRIVEEIQELVDLWLFDLKHMDSKTHYEVIGVPNDGILKNLRSLSGRKVWIRIPLIPGFNDGLDNIKASAEFMKKHGFNEVNILPYHRAGSEKSSKLLSCKGTTKIYEPPTEEKIMEISELFGSYGIQVKIGG
jgi:pyruvate formate lyase activating enzyme